VYLPQGTWYRWGTDTAHAGSTHIVAEAPLDEMPVFVRGGAIIPMWPLAQHTGAIKKANTILHLWPGNGTLDYYEDDGETRAFERGADGWRTTRMTLTQDKAGLTFKIAKPKGAYQSGREAWTVVVHRVKKASKAGKWNKARQTLTLNVPDEGREQTVVVKL
jgi:alpha-glucosidase